MAAVLVFGGLLSGLKTFHLVPYDSAFRPILDAFAGPMWLPFFGWWTILLIIVVGLSVWDAIARARRNDVTGLRHATAVVKLASIFFVIPATVSVVLNSVDTAQYLVGPLIGLGLIAVTLLLVACWLVLVSTSVYGWALIWRLRKNNSLSGSHAIWHSIYHGLFVADIASSLGLVVTARRS